MKNSYNLIAKFSYNAKSYLITLVNNNKILFICYENGEFKIDLSLEEYLIINTVYHSLRINELYSIDLGVKNINGRLYRIFYDRDSKNYYWKLQNKDDKVNELDNIILNFRYNNIPIKSYAKSDYSESKSEHTGNENNKKSRFFTKFIKIRKKTVIVFVAAAISLILLKGCSIFTPTYYQEFKNMILPEVLIEREYNFKEIKSAIENNPNLTDSEKEFMYKFKFVFDEYNQYMNLNRTIDRLSNLKITYVNGPCPEDTEDYTIGGTYAPMKNNITIYKAKDFESSDIRDFTHEFCHVFQGYSSSLVKELSNTAFASETLRRMYDLHLIEDRSIFEDEFGACTKFQDSYQKHMYLYYRLADLMNEEDLKKYQFSCDKYIILSSLIKISKKDNKTSNGYVTALKLLDTIDEMRPYNYITGDYEVIYDEKAYKSSCNYLDDYYKKLYGIDPKEDLNVAILYNTFNPCEVKNKEVIGKSIKKSLIDDGNIIRGYPIDYWNWVALPRTYLYNDYPDTKIIIHTPAKIYYEKYVTDELQDKYKENYKKIKEMDDIINAKENSIEY